MTSGPTETTTFGPPLPKNLEVRKTPRQQREDALRAKQAAGQPTGPAANWNAAMAPGGGGIVGLAGKGLGILADDLQSDIHGGRHAGGGVEELIAEDRAAFQGSVKNVWHMMFGKPEVADPNAVEAKMDEVMEAEALRLSDRYAEIEHSYSNFSVLAGEQLSPAGQQALDDLYKQAENQLNDFDNQIIETQQNAALYEMLKNPRQVASMADAQAAGIAPQGSATADVMARLVSEVGVTPDQAAQAGLSAGQVSQLAARGETLLDTAALGGDVEADLDGLSAEAAAVYAEAGLASGAQELDFQLQMRSRLRELTEQRRAVTDNFDEIQSTLQSEDLAQASQKFTLNLDPSPQGAYEEAFAEKAAPLIDTLAGDRPPAEQEAIAAALMELDTAVGSMLDEDAATNPQAAMLANGQIRQVAQQLNLDPEAVQVALNDARRSGLATMQEVENVWETNKFKPGSRGLATAVYEVAAESYDAEYANKLANSPALHMIIQLGSDGRVGGKPGSPLIGLGGIPADKLKTMGMDPAEVRGDPRAEVAALIELINSDFGGDPAAALQFFAENKSWGN